MQADEFEKKIKKKMEEFELVPGSAVWKEVSLKIEKEKRKRRVIFYWLFTGFLLLSASSAWWFINNENTQKFAKKDINDNAVKTENYETKRKTNSVSKNLNKINKTSIKNDAAPITKKLASAKNVELQKGTRNETKNNDSTKTIYPKVIAKELIANSENKRQNIHNREKQISASLPRHKFYNPDLAAKKADTSVINASNENADLKKNPAANTTAKKTIQTRNSGKWNMGFTVYGGSSNNRSGVPLLEKDYAQNYLPSGVQLNSGNYSYSEYISNHFKSGFSFGFGIYAKKQIAKKISLSAGADYHSYTAKLSVGSKVNQQQSFYDTSLHEAISVSQYYTPGTSESYSNKYQFLQLPVNLEYQINKNPKKPFLISAGISPGFLISSNALHANTWANVFYVDKQQFNHLQFSAQIGFSIPLISSSKYLLSAEPQIQYSFTNASKAAADARQHLFFTGIKANITLK